MTDQPLPRFGYSPTGRNPYWTRERVLAGLARYAQTYHKTIRQGQLPRAGEVLDAHRKTEPWIPPARVVWKYFGSLVDGWLAVEPAIARNRIPLKDGHVLWTDQDDAYLLDHAGEYSLAAIGRHLHRSPGACKVRLAKTFGTTARSNQGFLSAAEVAKQYGCPLSRVIRMLHRGDLPAGKSGHDNRWTIDPADAELMRLDLIAPKKTHREENGYVTDHGDYDRRYGLTRKRIGGRVVRVQVGAA